MPGYSEIEVAQESARAPRRDHDPDQDRAAGHDGRAAEDRLAPRRPGGRPGAGTAVLRREEGGRARHRRALRRGRRRVLRRLHDLPRAAVAGARATACPTPLQRGLRAVSQGDPGGREGQELPGARHDADRGALLRQRADLHRGGEAARCCAATTRRCATPTSPPRSTPRRPGSTTSPRCSTSTSTPGCAATSWSRPTGCRWRTRWSCGCRSSTGRSSRWRRGIPVDLKLPPRSDDTKYALRRALEGVVPPAIVNRKKLGFPTPTRVWLTRRDVRVGPRHPRRLRRRRAARPAVRAASCSTTHRAGEADHSRKVWTVLVFCIWHAIFVERIARPGHRAQPVRAAHQAGRRLDGLLSRR